MRTDKRKRLERAGWRVGTVRGFLGLGEAENALIEIRVALAVALRTRRLAQHLSQSELAKAWGRVSRAWRRWRPATQPSRSTSLFAP